MVGVQQGGAPGVVPEPSSDASTSPRLLPAKVKLEVEKNRTIVFLNERVKELTRKLELSHEDLYRYERDILGLRHEQRELSHRLPIQYAHVRKKATGYLAELNQVRPDRNLLTPCFRFWQDHAREKRKRERLVCVVLSRQSKAVVRKALTHWSVSAKRASGLAQWRSSRTVAKTVAAWAEVVLTAKVARAKIETFRRAHRPFFTRLLLGRALESWLSWTRRRRALEGKRRWLAAMLDRRSASTVLAVWSIHCQEKRRKRGRWQKCLRRKRAGKALRGWRDQVELAQWREQIVSKCRALWRRTILRGALKSWLARVRIERVLARRLDGTRAKMTRKMAEKSISGWKVVVGIWKARRIIVQGARAKAGERALASAFAAWARRCLRNARIREHRLRVDGQRRGASFVAWRRVREDMAQARRGAAEMRRQRKWRSKHRAFANWRIQVFAQSRADLLSRLETFEEGLVQVVASPMKSSRRRGQSQRIESKALQGGPTSVSAMESHRWHRFNKGYLISRAGHAAVFLGDGGEAQASGKYVIFGGHDLQTRQNTFTIVNVNCRLSPESGSLRFTADVVFESDTSIDGPSPRSDHCMCAADGRSVIVFGGFDGSKELGDVYRITWAAEDALQEISCERLVRHVDSPIRRSHHTVCRYLDRAHGQKTRFVMFGGYAKKSGGLMNDLWSFDPETRAWTELDAVGDVPAPRRDHCSAIISSSEMVVFGGFIGTRNVNDCYTLNLQTLRWTRLAIQGEPPGPRRQHTLVRLDKENVVICGGIDGTQVLQDVYCLNLTTLQCRPIGCLLEGGRCLHSCAPISGNLLIFGGVTSTGVAENDLLLLENAAATRATYLSTRASALETKLIAAERELEDEIADKKDARVLLARERTRNAFLETSLKQSIERQKEAGRSFRVVKEKLVKHRKGERDLRETCGDLRRQVSEHRKEAADARKMAAASARHHDSKIAETTFLADQLSRSQAQAQAQADLHKEQTLALERMSATLASTSAHLKVQQREKELVEYELSDARSRAKHLEKTLGDMEARIGAELARSSALEAELRSAQAQRDEVDGEAEDLRRAERLRAAGEAAKRPRDAAVQASPADEEAVPTASTGAQTRTYEEIAAEAASLAREEVRREEAERAERRKGSQAAEPKDLDEIVAETYALGAQNRSLSDQLEFSEGRNASLLKSVATLEDQNKYLEARLESSKAMEAEANEYVKRVQEEAADEIAKLKAEISRLRSTRYMEDLGEAEWVW